MSSESETPEPNVDKQHRICDKQGRPLRDRHARNFRGPFKGREDGAPHPRAKRLQRRQEAFDNDRKKDGRKRPGSPKR